MGPTAWFAQLLLSYPTAQLTCHAAFAPQHPAALHAISASALLAIASGAILLVRMKRRIAGDERREFMALLGLMTCALFAVVVVATWAPPFFINNCEA